jgi:hypothetical protein
MKLQRRHVTLDSKTISHDAMAGGTRLHPTIGRIKQVIIALRPEICIRKRQQLAIDSCLYRAPIQFASPS